MICYSIGASLANPYVGFAKMGMIEYVLAHSFMEFGKPTRICHMYIHIIMVNGDMALQNRVYTQDSVQ